MAGYVLSYIDTQAVWVAAGDITSIVTPAKSGLQGGMTSGET